MFNTELLEARGLLARGGSAAGKKGGPSGTKPKAFGGVRNMISRFFGRRGG